MANTTLVSPAVGDVNRLPCASATTQRSDPQSSSSKAPTGSKWSSFPSRLASVRDFLSSCNLLEESLSIYNASWRGSTAKSYDSAWNLWVSWCQQKSINPISSSLRDIIQFLTDQYHSGKQYSTINTYRSTISSSHPPIDGIVEGKHPIVCRFMQGVFNSRPSCPKYSHGMLILLLGIYMIRDHRRKLSLKVLSSKLVALLALSSANRSSDLIALDLNYRRFSPEGVVFTIPSLTKTM